MWSCIVFRSKGPSFLSEGTPSLPAERIFGEVVCQQWIFGGFFLT